MENNENPKAKARTSHNSGYVAQPRPAYPLAATASSSITTMNPGIENTGRLALTANCAPIPDAARMHLYTLYIRISNGVAVASGIFPMQRFTVFILATFLAVSAAEAGKMYKWVDEKGVTHFSSRQPPRETTDKTRLQGGTATQPQTSTESGDLANIKRKDFANPGWQGCASSLCRLVQQVDPDCQTSFCSRAKIYSNGCTSAACQTKKLTFKKEMQDRLEKQNALRQQQAVNANATPTPTPTAPASQSRD